MATALIVGTAGCSNAAGGNTYTPGNGDNEQEQGGYQKPSYMNVTAEFGGQRFAEGVEGNDSFHNNPNKDANFENYYKDAQDFMTYEVNNLQKLFNNSNGNYSTLSDQINTLLQKYNTESTIAQNIDNNHAALAPVFKTMRSSLTNNEEYNRFNVSYWKLAADAYNQSLGAYAGETTFTTNDELRNKSTNLFVTELADANLNYQQAADSTAATDRMKSYLNTIATETNTDVKVLKKIMQLALYNESLYGLNDHAVRASVNNSGLQDNQRSLKTFNNKINNASINYMQSLDDREM